MILFLFFFFFFQAEDGIRDVAVTGVQTCALPISLVLDKVLFLGARANAAFSSARLVAVNLDRGALDVAGVTDGDEQDRKSTRLNSSHGYISYAVFCLKKKNKHQLHKHHSLLVCHLNTHINMQ